MHFREFVRLQIGDHRNWPKQEANRDPGNRRNWYRISSLQEGAWRHVIKFENIDGTWQNNGSVAEPNNNDWIKRP